MKNMKLWLTTTLMLIVANHTIAQEYEAWPLGNSKSDTAVVMFQYSEPEDRGNGSLFTRSEMYLVEDTTVIMRGTKFTLKYPKEITYQDKSIFSAFTIGTPDKRPLVAVTDTTGKTYYADPYELRFSGTNAEGIEDPIAKYTDFRHPEFYEGAFLLVVLLFLWIAWRLSRRAAKIGLKKSLAVCKSAAACSGFCAFHASKSFCSFSISSCCFSPYAGSIRPSTSMLQVWRPSYVLTMPYRASSLCMSS